MNNQFIMRLEFYKSGDMEFEDKCYKFATDFFHRIEGIAEIGKGIYHVYPPYHEDTKPIDIVWLVVLFQDFCKTCSLDMLNCISYSSIMEVRCETSLKPIYEGVRLRERVRKVAKKESA